MTTWPQYTLTYQPRVVRGCRLRRPMCGCGCGKPAIWVGPRSEWANRFRAGRRTVLSATSGRMSASMPLRPRDRQAAVNLYAEYINGGIEVFPFDVRLGHSTVNPDRVRDELAGHDLACSCRAGQPCHAHVLLRIANDLVRDDGPRTETSEPT